MVTSKGEYPGVSVEIIGMNIVWLLYLCVANHV